MLEASLESYAWLQTGCRRGAACAATQIRHAQIMDVSGMTNRNRATDHNRPTLVALSRGISLDWLPDQARTWDLRRRDITEPAEPSHSKRAMPTPHRNRPLWRYWRSYRFLSAVLPRSIGMLSLSADVPLDESGAHS